MVDDTYFLDFKVATLTVERAIFLATKRKVSR